MPKVTVGDISMYYVEAGTGEPLVLVMGLGADHLAWGVQFPAFAERYRVIALNHPERVGSLQLHCTLGRPDDYLRAQLETGRVQRRKLTHEEAMRAGYLWLFAPSTYNERPEFVEMIIQNALANPYPMSLTGFERQCDAVETHDTLDRVTAIRCRTLVSVADQDILVPPRFSRSLAERIPGAELRLIEGAGHGYFWERSDLFNTTCLDFLSRV